MNKGKVFIISGPSGVGKDTILEGVFKKMPELCFSRSCITRPMRSGETPDGKYKFISREEFLEMLDKGDLLEYNEYAGNLYGTPRGPVDGWVNSGKSVIIEVDVNGAGNIKKALPDCIRIFIMPPSQEVLLKRLSGRKSDSAEAVKLRMEAAVKEMEHAKEYDYIVVNGELQKAIDDFCNIIKSQISE